MKKVLSTLIAATMLLSMTAGCDNGKEIDGKINISIGGWPAETNTVELERNEQYIAKFKETHPEVNVIPDTSQFDVSTYIMKATTGQLPTIYPVPATEMQNIIANGYGADITEVMQEYGYDKSMNPLLLDLVSKDGRIYGLPASGYCNGLYINKKLFKEAGLVNADGSIKIPRTWQEVAEFGQIITEKTGAAGFTIPTTQNCGGWHFVNIAWSYGVEFMKQDEEGKWYASFDTPEAVEALNYIKDLKWKYKTFPADNVIGYSDLYQIFGTYRSAMIIGNPPNNQLFQNYGMAIEDVSCVGIPAGPKGRFSQVGADLYVFSNTATPEQQRAVFEWRKLSGYSDIFDEERLEAKHQKNLDTIAQGGIVMPYNKFDLWTSEEAKAALRKVDGDDSNIDINDYIDYLESDDITMKPEYARCTQELYSVLDKTIQAVLADKNADTEALIKAAVNDFQVNHLDKIKY